MAEWIEARERLKGKFAKAHSKDGVGFDAATEGGAEGTGDGCESPLMQPFVPSPFAAPSMVSRMATRWLVDSGAGRDLVGERQVAH